MGVFFKVPHRFSSGGDGGDLMEGTMKRIIMLAMVLVMMLVSIGGCWVG